jgi:hypothetical protein
VSVFPCVSVPALANEADVHGIQHDGVSPDEWPVDMQERTADVVLVDARIKMPGPAVTPAEQILQNLHHEFPLLVEQSLPVVPGRDTCINLLQVEDSRVTCS